MWVPVGQHHVPRSWILLSSFRDQSHGHAASVCGARLHAELPVEWVHSLDKLSLEGLTEDDVEERVDAAVSVAHADGDVVGVGESQAWALDPEVDELEDVIRSPADEKRQADGHGHPGHFPGAHPQTPRGQRGHAVGHVLEDLEEHHTDDGQRDGKRKEKLVKREPVNVAGKIRQKESAGNQSICEGHQVHVHQHGDDGEHGQNPHQPNDQHRHTRRAHVVEANGMDRSQVPVEGHRSEDVSTDDLTVGVKCSDDRAHGSPKVPRAVAEQLMDEERHPKKKQ